MSNNEWLLVVRVVNFMALPVLYACSHGVEAGLAAVVALVCLCLWMVERYANADWFSWLVEW